MFRCWGLPAVLAQATLADVDGTQDLMLFQPETEILHALFKQPPKKQRDSSGSATDRGAGARFAVQLGWRSSRWRSFGRGASG